MDNDIELQRSKEPSFPNTASNFRQKIYKHNGDNGHIQTIKPLRGLKKKRTGWTVIERAPLSSY